ncbi:hypothetical protein MDAP_001059 [Mitosporidium daphniae]
MEQNSMSSTPTARGFPPLKQVFAKNYEDFLCKSDSSCGVMHTLPIIPDWLPCKVPVQIFLNEVLLNEMNEEIKKSRNIGPTGFLPALLQLANVATLPGIVGSSIGLPDIHSGYGFAIGNVAAFDANDPAAIVSPGGVGFDINCGVRLIRTNLTIDDINPIKEQLARSLFETLPVGIAGSQPKASSNIKIDIKNLNEILSTGVNWAVKNGYAWPEDLVTCEENGSIQPADPACVSQRAKGRGISQLGSLGAGNHYAEIQTVSCIYDEKAAKAMGISKIGQVCIMVHCGSRGLGHEIASNYIDLMKGAMERDNISIPDSQLACARINSREGQEYIRAMNAAANYAYCNRSILTFFIRKAFEKLFPAKTARELDMHLVYDVSHNMAKFEEHSIGQGENPTELRTLLVHRKGATRSFPPGHPSLPAMYSEIGQPVLVGGSMGTYSYVLTGGPNAMASSFGSTCHGAGRAKSRVEAKKTLSSQEILSRLQKDGITVCIADISSLSEEVKVES